MAAAAVQKTGKEVFNPRYIGAKNSVIVDPFLADFSQPHTPAVLTPGAQTIEAELIAAGRPEEGMSDTPERYRRFSA